MTPQEKAKELVDKMHLINSIKLAKQCAIIAVNEIQNTKSVYVNHTEYDYWEQVKTEIENL